MCCTCNIDWTAVSAIATLVMALATFITIRQNKKQLKELQRQWNEANRARLTFSIVVINGLYLLKITNYGTATAYNISIKLRGDLVDNHFSDSIKDWAQALESKPFCIEAGVSKHYDISPISGYENCCIHGKTYSGAQIDKWLEEHKGDKISITGKYCDRYDISEEFSIEDFINGAMVVNNELVSAIDRLKKSVDSIAKSTEVIKTNTKPQSK